MATQKRTNPIFSNKFHFHAICSLRGVRTGRHKRTSRTSGRDLDGIHHPADRWGKLKLMVTKPYEIYFHGIHDGSNSIPSLEFTMKDLIKMKEFDYTFLKVHHNEV